MSKKKNKNIICIHLEHVQKKQNKKHYFYSIGQCQKRKKKNIICIQ